MSDQDIWTELYDPKEGRKLREIPMQFGKCQECQQFNGHRLDCSSATKEHLYRIAKTAQDAEELARKRADRYWKMLQQYQGKLAILKHENNKLRKANERLNAAMKAGEIEIELCNDCGCDVATWNSSNAAMCVDCCMCEEEQ